MVSSIPQGAASVSAAWKSLLQTFAVMGLSEIQMTLPWSPYRPEAGH